MRAVSTTVVQGLTALHVLMCVHDPIEFGNLSSAAKIPKPALRTILRRLVKSGLAAREVRRGYSLAKAPGEIRLLDVISALDSPERPAAPCGGDFEACPNRAACVLAVLCRKADESFSETIRSFTLEELRDASPDLPNCLDPAVMRLESAGRSAPARRHAR